jgi:hypothetical protein
MLYPTLHGSTLPRPHQPIFIGSRQGIESCETLRWAPRGFVKQLHNLSNIHRYEADTHGQAFLNACYGKHYTQIYNIFTIFGRDWFNTYIIGALISCRKFAVWC